MPLDLDGFATLPVDWQELVVGRRRVSSRPLFSGAEIDLGAMSPTGDYLIHADAQVRRANPLSAGVGLMLRLSYSHDEELLFISFQRDMDTFVNTMRRMVGNDALLRYATTTASASSWFPRAPDRKQDDRSGQRTTVVPPVIRTVAGRVALDRAETAGVTADPTAATNHNRHRHVASGAAGVGPEIIFHDVDDDIVVNDDEVGIMMDPSVDHDPHMIS